MLSKIEGFVLIIAGLVLCAALGFGFWQRGQVKSLKAEVAKAELTIQGYKEASRIKDVGIAVSAKASVAKVAVAKRQGEVHAADQAVLAKEVEWASTPLPPDVRDRLLDN